MPLPIQRQRHHLWSSFISQTTTVWQIILSQDGNGIGCTSLRIKLESLIQKTSGKLYAAKYIQYDCNIKADIVQLSRIKPFYRKGRCGMLQAYLLESISEAKYLSADNYRVYRTIMRIFYLEHQKMHDHMNFALFWTGSGSPGRRTGGSISA